MPHESAVHGGLMCQLQPRLCAFAGMLPQQRHQMMQVGPVRCNTEWPAGACLRTHHINLQPTDVRSILACCSPQRHTKSRSLSTQKAECHMAYVPLPHQLLQSCSRHRLPSMPFKKVCVAAVSPMPDWPVTQPLRCHKSPACAPGGFRCQCCSAEVCCPILVAAAVFLLL